MNILKEDTLKVLRRARGLLAEPDAWIQGQSARDSDGQVVSPTSPRATAWCALGAINAASGERARATGRIAAYGAARRVVEGCIPVDWRPDTTIEWTDRSLISWNDEPGRPQDEVVRLFDRAIAGLEAEVEAPAPVEEMT